ncbi:MAG: SCO1664 family protein [Actinomycetota bacterium]
MTSGARPAVAAALELLALGDVEVLGLLPYSSNYVFLARLCREGTDALAIYKPRRGESPLWDFPRGTLAAREVAAFLVSEAAGWHLVPPTVLRPDAPMGVGSLQLFIEHDPQQHYFTLLEQRAREFIAFAAFDVVINNADRKAGHVISDADGRLWGVDHGVTFHEHEKLRTVIWHFAGQPLDEGTRVRLTRLTAALKDGEGLRHELRRLLSEDEVAAALRRTERLLDEGCLPLPASDHHLPWPLI